MFSSRDRRGFLKRVAAAGAAVGLGDLSFPAGLPPVSAADLQPLPGVVPLRPESELCRCAFWNTRCASGSSRPRRPSGCAAARPTARCSPRCCWPASATCSRGRRSASSFMPCSSSSRVHLTSQASADTERWLPLFWGLDYFKQAQAQDVREGDWTMRSTRRTKLPVPAELPRPRFPPGDGPLGRAGRRRRRGRAVRGQPATNCPRRPVFASTVPATSADRPQGDLRRQRASHARGDRPAATPSRSCVRSPTRCCSTRATTRPTVTPTPIDPAARTRATATPGGAPRLADPVGRTQRLPLYGCSTCCALQVRGGFVGLGRRTGQ